MNIDNLWTNLIWAKSLCIYEIMLGLLSCGILHSDIICKLSVNTVKISTQLYKIFDINSRISIEPQIKAGMIIVIL